MNVDKRNIDMLSKYFGFTFSKKNESIWRHLKKHISDNILDSIEYNLDFFSSLFFLRIFLVLIISLILRCSSILWGDVITSNTSSDDPYHHLKGCVTSLATQHSNVTSSICLALLNESKLPWVGKFLERSHSRRFVSFVILASFWKLKNSILKENEYIDINLKFPKVRI